MGVAIVAIPNEQDPVWKFSSEKVPHMTLIFLGDLTDGEALTQIGMFMQHIADTSLTRFGMSVDRRGTLGPDDADVLFFRDKHDRQVKVARANMLQEPHIRAAFEQSDQFPEWTPHLTMGYPATPAKEDDREYPGFNWVQFDRLALWTGDYDGPTFQLKDEYDDFLASPDEVAMASNSTNEYAGISLNPMILAHHGVKGMHWGVRNDSAGGSAKPTRAEKKVAKADKKFGKEIANANQGKATLAFHNELVTRVNKAVDDLNGSDKYRDVDLNSYTGQLKKDYEKDSQEAIMRSFEDATRSHFGYNPSGTKRAVYNRKTDKIDLVDTTPSDIHHVDAPKEKVPDVTLQLKRNAKGLIESVTVVDSAKHSIAGIDLDADILAHHGVKGMKWGVRKEEDGGGGSGGGKEKVGDKLKREVTERTGTDTVVRVKPGQTVQVVGGNKREASADAIKARTAQQVAKKSTLDALSNKELQDLVTRMNLEQQYNRLALEEGDSRLPAGQKFAKDMLNEHGDTAVKALAANPSTAAVAVPVGIALSGYKAVTSRQQAKLENAPGARKGKNNKND